MNCSDSAPPTHQTSAPNRHVHVEISRAHSPVRIRTAPPLRGTHQAFFFAIPTGKKSWCASVSSQTHSSPIPCARLQHCRVPLFGSTAPKPTRRDGCPAITHLPGGRCTHAPITSPERAKLIVLLQVHLYAYRTWPHVIRERQRALPFARRVWPAKC